MRGHPAVAALDLGPVGSGEPTGPTGSVDHKVGPYRLPGRARRDHDPGDPVVVEDDVVGVAAHPADARLAETAADLMWTLIDPALYHRLVHRAGLTPEQFREWLAYTRRTQIIELDRSGG